ncbi:MAG: AAA family ATPase, partial [Actinobacteria bacterium]|nr:AAA family ATPase [Actinomycetota bacterium]
MLLGSRPLYDNLGDSRLFRSPPTWDPILRAVERHLNVAVVGPRGVGKTTLLRQLQLTLREGSAERVTFVDATAVADVLELAARIRDALVGEASAAAEFPRGDAALVGGASRELAAMLREIGQAGPST